MLYCQRYKYGVEKMQCGETKKEYGKYVKKGFGWKVCQEIGRRNQNDKVQGETTVDNQKYDVLCSIRGIKLCNKTRNNFLKKGPFYAWFDDLPVAEAHTTAVKAQLQVVLDASDWLCVVANTKEADFLVNICCIVVEANV